MTDQRHTNQPFDATSTLQPKDIRNRTNLPPTWVDPARNPDDGDRSLLLKTAILQPSVEIMALAARRDSLSTDEPCLILQSGKGQGTAINLLPLEKDAVSTWVIGCEADCDILLNEVGVSAFHAMVVHDDGQWTLADQQSASGTFVNGKPCLKRVLHDGDQLQFGRVKSTFHVPERYRPRAKISTTERLMQALRTVVSMPLAVLARKRGGHIDE
jgi:hypothetical protein